MTQNHASDAEQITCENMTDEIAADYTGRGYTLAFAEEVMRFDLYQPIPDVAFPPSVTCLNWTPETTHQFFAAYEAAFRERPGFPGWSEEEWVGNMLEGPPFRTDLSWVAIAEGQPVGFITNEDDDQAPQQVGYIIQVGTHPHWRGQGVGAALITRVLQAWKDEGKKYALLHVNVNNLRAIHLYQRLGFAIVGRRGKFSKQRE